MRLLRLVDPPVGVFRRGGSLLQHSPGHIQYTHPHCHYPAGLLGLHTQGLPHLATVATNFHGQQLRRLGEVGQAMRYTLPKLPACTKGW